MTASEQITIDATLEIAQDQPLTVKQLRKCIIDTLGKEECRIVRIHPRRWALEYVNGGKTYHLLVKNCTYLGKPHPIYKKRIQLPLWFNEYAKANHNIDVRYIGVYHFNGNVIFIDFKKDTYINKKGHNSSAHVYTNDLFQTMSCGIFSKVDHMGNTITAARKDMFAKYLAEGATAGKSLFSLFGEFNADFFTGKWIEAIDAIQEMHKHHWPNWKQTEWAGWYVEYKFNAFTKKDNVCQRMRYVGSSQKRKGDFDFDVKFIEEDFYGDLKSSDITKTESPGNDHDNFIRCIERYGKFWYIIYEHATVKDSINTGFKATKDRKRYLEEQNIKQIEKERPNHRYIKNKVQFLKMTIIELNPINYREVLKEFKQGHQPNGEPRKPKFNIDKKALNNDNYVVYRYTFPL